MSLESLYLTRNVMPSLRECGVYVTLTVSEDAPKCDPRNMADGLESQEISGLLNIGSCPTGEFAQRGANLDEQQWELPSQTCACPAVEAVCMTEACGTPTPRCQQHLPGAIPIGPKESRIQRMSWT